MQPQHARLNTYHTHKQRVLGNTAAAPPPAWRPNARAPSGSHADAGSKILLSRLPIDVMEDEVEILFSRTVGPVKEVVMVHNDQGKSRGTAIVLFARAGDAAIARTKYNGKIVDRSRPIKIEIIVDEDDPRKAAPAPASAPSLFSRITPAPGQAPLVPQPNGQRAAQAHVNNAKAKVASTPATVLASVPATIAVHAPKVRLRMKKGPRRLNKQLARQQAQQRTKPKSKTAEELDQEMDDYRARVVRTTI